RFNGEDYDVISIAVDIPGFGRPTDTVLTEEDGQRLGGHPLEANVKNATKGGHEERDEVLMKTKPAAAAPPGRDKTWETELINSIKAFHATAELLSRSTASCLLLGLCIDECAKIRERTTHRHRMCTTYGKLQSAGIQRDYYDCVGADLQFVGEMIRRGYRHEAAAAGHCADKFATLCFQEELASLHQGGEPAQPEKPAPSS
uniref:Complex I-9kD n=1 Tax=Macrostomum lignano TaxID=282301 RepID=A0A1I8FER6_9PLAT